ncbi:DUF1062 domain-containing protein [Oryzifoliimicrobium ureilyticus]|uniref:DUF1062 domain-containing protein n=1 Tax=Oryzifoliimicrobium ureilyticus TaxID=3113724 RepID=UPI0030764592
MCKTLRVRWTLTPRKAPEPFIACSGCKGLRAFRCSGKIRLNANGRRLDAWLIYKCVDCDKTWNRAIFERQTLRDIDPTTLAALQSSDPGWVRAEAFNLEALRRKAQRIDEFDDLLIEKAIVHEASGWTRLAIELAVPLPVSTRLDRLLAFELKVSRSALQRLAEAGMVRIDTGHADALRRRVKSGTVINIDLAGWLEKDRQLRPLATGSPS